MTSGITGTLTALSDAGGADAVVLWRRGADGSAAIVGARPEGIADGGTQFPGALDDRDAPLLSADPRDVARLIPTSMRLAMPGPVRSVALVAVAQTPYRLVAAWCRADPPDGALDALQRLCSGPLAADVEREDVLAQAQAAQALLGTVVESLDQGVVIVRYDGGPGEVNAVGARLLDVPPGPVAPERLARAMRQLRRRSRDPEGIEARAEVILTTPDLVVRDWVWTFAEEPTHLRVHTAPFRSERVSGRVWVLDDISTQMQLLEREQAARAELAASEDRFRLLAENASDVVFRISLDGVLEWVSPSVRATLGWEPEELVGRSIPSLLHADDLPARDAATVALATSDRMSYRARFGLRDGSYRWMEFTARPVRDRDGTVVARVGSARDVHDQVQAELELTYRATYDDLTGAFKRDEIMARLEALSAGERRTDAGSAVVFIDVDKFKSVNDTYGHAVGDELLIAISRGVSDAVRGSDLLARMGGDEFLVVLEGVDDLDHATALAEKIRASAAQPVATSAGPVQATLSIGVTLMRPGEDIDAMIARADRAMYEAKQQGRNQVVPVPPG